MGLIERLQHQEEPAVAAAPLWAALHEYSQGFSRAFPSVQSVADAFEITDPLEVAELFSFAAQLRSGSLVDSLNLLATLILATTRNKSGGASTGTFVPGSYVESQTGITRKPPRGGARAEEITGPAAPIR